MTGPTPDELAAAGVTPDVIKEWGTTYQELGEVIGDPERVRREAAASLAEENANIEALIDQALAYMARDPDDRTKALAGFVTETMQGLTREEMESVSHDRLMMLLLLAIWKAAEAVEDLAGLSDGQHRRGTTS